MEFVGCWKVSCNGIYRMGSFVRKVVGDEMRDAGILGQDMLGVVNPSRIDGSNVLLTFQQKIWIFARYLLVTAVFCE